MSSGQPAIELVLGLLAGEYFEPLDTPLASVGLSNCGVEHQLRRTPDVRPGAIPLDVGDDGCVRDLQCASVEGDRFASARGHLDSRMLTWCGALVLGGAARPR